MNVFNPNIKKIYTFNFFWLFIVIMPLLYRYYTDLGMSVAQFFYLQAIFALTVGVFDIPTGYFSDRYGRKTSLLVGSLFSGVGYIVLLYSNSFLDLALHEFLLGIALSFISGTDIAILYDSLPEDSNRAQTSKALGGTHLAYASGEAFGALCSVVLISFSMRHVLITQVVISWLPLIVALFVKEPTHRRKEAPSIKNIKVIWQYLLHGDHLLRLLAMNFVSNLLIAFMVVWIMQKYWQENHVPLEWFGVLWASFTILIGLSSHFTHVFEKLWGANRILLTIPIICTLGYALMAFLPGYWGIVAGALIYFARGLNNVIYRDILNWRVESDLRATANSIFNFLFRLAFTVAGPLIGLSIDALGLHRTLYGVSLFCLALCILCTYPLARKIKDIRF